LLPSFTAAPPPAIKEHLQYLDQANASQAQALGAGAMARPFGYHASPNSVPSGVAGWIASMAGVDPTNPTQPQQKHDWGLGRQSDAAKATAAVGLPRFAVSALIVSVPDQVFLDIRGAAFVHAGSARESRDHRFSKLKRSLLREWWRVF
jgi:hypothetical protein